MRKMEPNKQTSEKPCSILKNSKTPSKFDYLLSSPSTETMLKRVSFSKKKLVKKFDRHGDLNSSCESSDMSSVSANCSIEDMIQKSIPICQDEINIFVNETAGPSTVPESLSLKRVIDHDEKDDLKKCKFDIREANDDKENISCVENMSMTCVLPTLVHSRETEIAHGHVQKKDEDKTQLFRNDEMEMSLTSDIRSANVVSNLNSETESDVPGVDMSMTTAVLPSLQTNLQLEEELNRVSVPQCNSVLSEPANQSFEMNMSLTCAVSSGIERPLCQILVEESQRSLTKCLQAVSNCNDQSFDVNMSMTCAVETRSRTEPKTTHVSKETTRNDDSKEETVDQSFGANMSETSAVLSNGIEILTDKITKELGNALKEMNTLKSQSNSGTQIEENDERDGKSCVSGQSLNMDMSLDSSADTNNLSKSCHFRASSCLNNNMDGSFLKNLAEQNRDLLTDDGSLIANVQNPLADEEQLDDIEEPPTFMSGASKTLDNSTFLDISDDDIKSYELQNQFDNELTQYKINVQELKNVLKEAETTMKQADTYLLMESILCNRPINTQKNINDNIRNEQIDPFEEMKNQVEKISSRDDCYWSIIELTTEKMIVGFISNSLLLNLIWKPFDKETMSNILDVTIRSRLKDDANDVYLRIAHDYCLRDLNPNLLKVSYTRYKDVPKMISFVYNEVNSILYMVEDLRFLSRLHVMKIQRDKFTITLNSDNYKEIHKITIQIKPIEMFVPKDITVECILGRAEEHKIRDNVKFVRRDKTFFKMLLQDLTAYLNIVSNN